MTEQSAEPPAAQNTGGAGQDTVTPPAAPPAALRDGTADRIAGRTAEIVAPPGGVMTDEVGVVTGELTLRTELNQGTVTMDVRYRDADEWYRVTNVAATLADPADLDAVHAVAVGLLHRPEG